MARARLAAMAAMVLVLLAATTASAVPVIRLAPAAGAAGTVDWPASSRLLIAEVVTGGVSASDEYVELTNAATEPLDLLGLEVAYVTSSGATVTRKASWDASLLIAPGRHLLLANSLGLYASAADATYSGGLSSSGGAIVLRPTGGAPIDAVGWGDAVNGFVEGTAATAPAAGSSIERRPGGIDGNTFDSNDNATDFVVNSAPEGRNLEADPLPAPSPSDSPAPSPTPTISPIPTATPAPTPTPLPSPTNSPTASPSPVSPPTPAPTATLAPTPTPSPTPVPTPTPAPSTAPAIAIQAARDLTDGTPATVRGVLTTRLGALESGRTGFVQDATAGIAIYLDAPLAESLPEGTVVVASGSLGSRYGQRTLRVDASSVLAIGSADLPVPLVVPTGMAAEPLEGRRLELRGTVTGAPSSLADGLGLTVDDGTGPVRVVVTPDALAALGPTAGSEVLVQGPLGQRDSSGSGTSGYRLYATLPGELEVDEPTPSPIPTATPTATPTFTPSPTVAPSPTVGPSPTPAPTLPPTPVPDVSSIAAARLAPVGTLVVVRGVVVAEAGRLGTPPLVAIADPTGGVPVRMPDDFPAPRQGTLVEVRGTTADPYGQTEIRPKSSGITVLGTGTIPAPLMLAAGSVGEGVEGRLVAIPGTISVAATRATSHDLAFTIRGDDGASLTVRVDASAGLDKNALRKGLVATFTGVVGQRASHKGLLDGYRLWLRDPADVAASASPPPSDAPASPSPSGGASASPVSTIAAARIHEGTRVTVEGVLTVDRMLLDSTGRRTVVEDPTGAIEVYLAKPDSGLHVGEQVRVSGTIGRAWGAPRLKADEVSVLGAREPVAHMLRSRPSASTEWRLVRISGTIVDLHRSGDRWLAELDTGAGRVPVQGLTGSGTSASSIIVGRAATITGIVKRPYPTATDRRFALVPRTSADIAIGPAGSDPGSSRVRAATSSLAPALLEAIGGTVPPGIDLRDLAAHLGERVRVGGLVTDDTPDGVRLDDGTATSRIVLDGDAADLAGLLVPGDALDATGIPETRGEVVLVVSDPAAVELAADLGAGDPAPIGADRIPSFGLAAVASPPRTGVTRTVSSARPGGVAAVLAVLAVLLAGVTALALTLTRREQARRRLRGRIVDRLASLANGEAAEGGAGKTAPSGGDVEAGRATDGRETAGHQA